MFWTSLLVNVGMWLERFILVVTPLSYKQPFVFTWVESYQPRTIEYVLSVSVVGMVALGLLIFAKLFPIIPIWDVEEGQIVKARSRSGGATFNLGCDGGGLWLGVTWGGEVVLGGGLGFRSSGSSGLGGRGRRRRRLGRRGST
jgi:hypothetical protein